MGTRFQSTPAYRRGFIGEEIVQKFLTGRGCNVRRPNDTAPSGASLIDFVFDAPKKFSPWKGTELAEVKVRTTMDYSYGRFPVYTFPVSQVENYQRYAAEKNLCLNLFVVDDEREQIFWRDWSELEIPVRIEEKTFPADVEQKSGLFRYYHVSQFVPVAKPYFSDIERFAAVKFPNADKKIPDDNELAESRAVVTKYLDVKLPDDIPSADEKILAFVHALRPKFRRLPTYFLYEIYHAVRNLNAAEPMPTFAQKFYRLLDSLKRQRQKSSYDPPHIFKPTTPAQKISDLHAPNGTTLEIFSLTDERPRFYVELIRLAQAFGYDTHALIHSNLGNAVKATSRFYSVSCGSTDKKISVVDAKDVAAILDEYALNREDDADKYRAVKNFLPWWKQAVVDMTKTI